MSHIRGFRMVAAVAATLAVGATAGPARADLVFSGTGSTDAGVNPAASLSATVDFSLVGQTLQVVITNNDPSLAPSSVLTNVAITVAPAPATALPSASGTIALTAGSTLVGPGVGSASPLGDEWAYVSGASGGAASSGFGVGATANNNGNLCGATTCSSSEAKLGDASYGLVGNGTNASSNNLKNGGKGVYVENSVTIDILLASNSTFTLSDITGVDFQYGTQANEGDITVDGCTGGSDCGGGGGGGPSGGPVPAPEPGSLALLGAALTGLGFVHRRRKFG